MERMVIKNASWIIGCKIIQSLISFLIGIFTARYLGPKNYGLIAYAASITAFVIPIMQLGLNSILVIEFIQNPDNNGEILGTSFVLNLISSLLSIAGIIAFTFLVNKGEDIAIIVCALYSCSLIFKAFEMTQYWFQAKLQSKYTSIAALIAYLCVAIYRVFLLATGKSIYWFAISYSIDGFLISILYIIFYKHCNGQKLSFSYQKAKEMISKSKYYILSSMLVVIFQQTDRVMLKIMIGDEETAYYSVAITCIGITGFIFTAIIDSARPAILKYKTIDNKKYLEKIVVLYSVITILSFSQSIFMTIFARPIIQIIYGNDYLNAIPALQIGVWFTTFGYYGVVRNIWILGENKQKYLWIINIIGASLNVGLNFYFIPIFGCVGAAIASLITQIFINFIVSFIIKPIRYNNTLIFKGLNLKYLYYYIKDREHKEIS